MVSLICIIYISFVILLKNMYIYLLFKNSYCGYVYSYGIFKMLFLFKINGEILIINLMFE